MASRGVPAAYLGAFSRIAKWREREETASAAAPAGDAPPGKRQTLVAVATTTQTMENQMGTDTRWTDS